MNEGDTLILKTDMFLDIPKYTKVNIYRYRLASSLYIIEIDGSDCNKIISENSLKHFWTLAEYRKLKIEDLI